MSNSNKEEFNKQDTAEGKGNVKIVTMDVKIFGKFAGSSYPKRTGKQAAEKWHKQLNNFKQNKVEKLKKEIGENKWLAKDINNMRAVINTLAPSLGEEGTKTIGHLKRQIVLMEEENINLFNKKIFPRNLQKSIPK